MAKSVKVNGYLTGLSVEKFERFLGILFSSTFTRGHLCTFVPE